MKTKLTLLFTILYMAGFSQVEFAPIGAEWYYCLPDENGNPFYSYEKYISRKDTMIEGKICRLVSSQINSEVLYVNQKKIYYRFKEKFNLIYDFSAQLGDTISFDFKSFSPNSFVIDTTYSVKCVIEKIDSMLIDGRVIKTFEAKILRRQQLDHLVWDSIYKFTEKFGYEFDFMYVLSIPTIDVMTNLRCYNDYDVSIKTDWWSGQNKPCNYSLINSSSKYNQLHNQKIKFFPNPSNNQITIVLPQQSIVESFKLYIYNISGQEIYSVDFISQQQEINISHFPIGTYHFFVRNNELTFNPFKIVKL